MDNNTVQINNCRISYNYNKHANDKTIPLVFLHGMAACYRMWQPQIDYFKKFYTTLAITLPGSEGSNCTDEPNCYSIKNFADITCALMDKLAIDRAVLIGNSMGGVIAYHIKKTSPNRVAMIFTNGTTPALHHSRLTVKLITVLDWLMLKLLGSDKMMKILASQVTKQEDAKQSIYDSMKGADPNMLAPVHRALSDYDYLDTFKLNDSPVYIIKGENDTQINQSINQFSSELSTYPHCHLHYIESVGHILNLEIPDQYNAIVHTAIKTYEGMA